MNAPWTLEQALQLVRELEPDLKAAGWYPGLTGSVLLRGESLKDLDLIVYPMVGPITASLRGELRRVLRSHGLSLTFDEEFVRRQWLKKGGGGTKHVEVWHRGPQRVDLFVLG